MTIPDITYEGNTHPSAPRGDYEERTDPSAIMRPNDGPKFPAPIIPGLKEEKVTAFKNWLTEWIQQLESDFASKHKEWADQETAYRAKPDAAKTKPYIGADVTVIPAIGMAVDPIHARLDIGVFKQDPVFQMKALRKSMVDYIPALNAWVDFYQKNRLKLRQVAHPRILECAKLGTMIFKTVYDREEYTIMTYNEKFEPVKKTLTSFKGPRVFGVSLDNFYFPAGYQTVQECPIVFERLKTTYGRLKKAEAAGKLADCSPLIGAESRELTDLEDVREKMANIQSSRQQDNLIIYELWCEYDINDDGIPENLIATYHKDTNTLLQLRYNWYFHQRKPYTAVPYMIVNGSIHGLGIAEMVIPFQKALSKLQQMSTDNAYLANLRMFIVKKNSGIEEVPRLYAGRCFFVDEPKTDFIPFAVADIYPSTLSERQNLFGMVEKRTGVSDYLTGRESPIIGTRATATSTLALIKEGTQRVEEVLENLRTGFAEIIENCFYIWIQYGLEDLDEIAFADDDIAVKLKDFFTNVATAESINGALGIDLTVTDASTNAQAMQQMQLMVIQTMMGYLEKVLAAAQAAHQMAAVDPAMSQMIIEVMRAARAMFKDLLNKYQIRNVEDYLPDLEKYINGSLGQNAGGAGGQAIPVPGPQGPPMLPPGTGAFRGPTAPTPATPGSGDGPFGNGQVARGGQGIQGLTSLS